MLDQSKISGDLIVLRVWTPKDALDRRRPIAYVAEPRRRIAGAALLALAMILVPATLALRAPFWVDFAPLLIAWAATAYAQGGRTGFYRVGPDGALGEFLSRRRPDVSSMRSQKP